MTENKNQNNKTITKIQAYSTDAPLKGSVDAPSIGLGSVNVPMKESIDAPSNSKAKQVSSKITASD